MKRSISSTALLFASVSAILGSGWLFVAYYTSTYAGPSALISWLIGGVAVTIVAFVFAELSAMLPITGSSTRIPQYTHGTLVSFIFSWLIWLSYVAMAPTEVQAIIQYLSYYFPHLTHTSGALTESGYITATSLMLVVSAINVFSLRWLIRANNILTVIKIVIPIIISLVILLLFFTPKHVLHPNHSTFMPYGFHGILGAITSGGIIFAFNGFKQACEMAGEAKHPSRNLPIAIIGSISVCLIIYLLLQTAFLSSLDASNLTSGWQNIQIRGDNSPIAAIVYQDHLTWLAPLLYLGAIIGPLAAGLMYAGSSARSLYGQSKNGYLPLFLQKITTQGSPIYAILINFVVGMCMFAPLPGWSKMIAFLTSLMAITYAIAPVALLALRDQVPKQKRPFKLPFPKLWSVLAFYICTLLAYWSGWTVISKLSIAIFIGLAILLGYHFGTKRGREIKFNWKSSVWIWPYFLGLTIISYLGNFGHGLNLIPFGWDFVIIAIFCLIVLELAQKFKLPATRTDQYINALNLNH